MIIGIDEVGRGPWFGDIVAVSFTILDHKIKKTDLFKMITDSKKLNLKKREFIYEGLIKYSLGKNPKVLFGIGVVSNELIDEINIGKANKLAMQKSLKDITNKIEYNGNIEVLIDGNYKYEFDFGNNFNYKSVIKGDLSVIEISCASIIAKVFRDNLMKVYSTLYPELGLENNAGYGTKKHKEYLSSSKKITPFHRKSYNPIKTLLNNPK